MMASSSGVQVTPSSAAVRKSSSSDCFCTPQMGTTLSYRVKKA